MSKDNSKSKETEIKYYSETKVVEVWLFNGQVIPIQTGQKPAKVERFGQSWLRAIDDRKTMIDVRIDAIAYIRVYSKKRHDELLKYGEDKKDKETKEGSDYE